MSWTNYDFNVLWCHENLSICGLSISTNIGSHRPQCGGGRCYTFGPSDDSVQALLAVAHLEGSNDTSGSSTCDGPRNDMLIPRGFFVLESWYEASQLSHDLGKSPSLNVLTR